VEFEWDGAKATSNLRKHRVAFEDVTGVFDDLYAMHFADRSMNYGEERFAAVGMVDGIVYYVAYTERGDLICIISARKATRLELKAYDRERQG
jgi:uncharacterized DUF497 family protein